QPAGDPAGGDADGTGDGGVGVAFGDEPLVAAGLGQRTELLPLEIFDQQQLQLVGRGERSHQDRHLGQADAAGCGEAAVAGDDGAVGGDQQRLQDATQVGVGDDRGGELV